MLTLKFSFYRNWSESSGRALEDLLRSRNPAPKTTLMRVYLYPNLALKVIGKPVFRKARVVVCFAVNNQLLTSNSPWEFLKERSSFLPHTPETDGAGTFRKPWVVSVRNGLPGARSLGGWEEGGAEPAVHRPRVRFQQKLLPSLCKEIFSSATCIVNLFINQEGSRLLW